MTETEEQLKVFIGFFALSQEEQGSTLLAIASRYLSDLGAGQVKFQRNEGEPLTLCFAKGVPAVMLAGAHEKIKSLTLGLPSEETTLRFTNGQMVRITKGAFMGLRGKVVGYLNAKALLVKLVGRPRPLAIYVDSLEGV